MVVKQPQFTRVEEPTLLCNQVHPGTSLVISRVTRTKVQCQYFTCPVCVESTSKKDSGISNSSE